MDRNIAALIETLTAQQQMQTQQTTELISRMERNQNVLLERLASTPNGVGHADPRRPDASGNPRVNLVDSRGVAKPPTLTAAQAEKPGSFKTWRIKYSNWILAAFPNHSVVLRGIEEQTQTEITADRFAELLVDDQELAAPSANIRCTLVSMTEDEPFSIVTKAPAGAHGGLEALRRLYHRYDPTGPRSAKVVLKRILSVKSVPVRNLRIAIEELERLYEEYEGRAGVTLQEDLRMQCLEQLLEGPLAQHIDLNAGAYPSYSALRGEIWRYAERIAQLDTGVVPMDIGALTGQKADPKPGKPSEKPKVTCFTCGKQGHRAAECWHNQSPAPQPSGGKPGKGGKGGKNSGKSPPGKGKPGQLAKSKSKGANAGKKGKGKGNKNPVYGLENGPPATESPGGDWPEYDDGAEYPPEEQWPGDAGAGGGEIGSLFMLQPEAGNSDLMTSVAISDQRPQSDQRSQSTFRNSRYRRAMMSKSTTSRGTQTPVSFVDDIHKGYKAGPDRYWVRGPKKARQRRDRGSSEYRHGAESRDVPIK